jgi:hypothetical protein
MKGVNKIVNKEKKTTWINWKDKITYKGLAIISSYQIIYIYIGIVFES